MGLKTRFLDWLHPYQAIIKIVEHCLSEHNTIQRSIWRGEELDQLTLTSSLHGTTDRTYDCGRQIVVSLTTHGKRLYEVHRSIESIMQGTWKPNQIVLWLSDELIGKPIPETLLRQQQRGLQIRYVKDLGPHTKLIPALRQFPDDVIVTIDDDMYYQYDMLENLILAYLQDPTSIHSNRVAVMTFDSRHRLKSYMDWQHYIHPETDTIYNRLTGVEGCLYPPHALSEEVFNEQVFRSDCRYADDVWFTAMAILKGTMIRHLYTHYERGCAGGIENKSVQDIGLWGLNDSYLDCRNDHQIRAVFSRYGIYECL